MKRLLVWLVLTLGGLTSLNAQEICNNGRDDDGDGFIDCYDNSCSASTFCKDFFLGEEAECEVTPPAFPQFTMALDFASPNETTNHLSRMAIGDLNRDGTPEIVTMNRYTKRIFILNGSDASIQRQATVDFEPNWEIAIANIDNDACGEIYFFGYLDPPGDNNGGNYIFAYDCQLNFLWRTAQRLRGDPINYGLADFNGDGKTELYIKDAVYDAHTGTRLIASNGSTPWGEINGGPVAVDMMGNEDLELVIGLKIYSVNLGNGTADNGSLTLQASRNEYFIRNEYNATSVADYNQDDHLDILASGSTIDHGENTTVFFWDVHNNTLDTYSDPIPGNFTIFACPTQTGEYYKNGWKNGTGRLNIADLDGDGNLNVSYVSGKFLYALDHNMDPMPWSPKLVNEETSGHTGCTLFDFNGDGKYEIVYRDERFLYIINGTTGTIYNQQACVSRTNREYPIVADVDADGSTELCVTCGFDDEDAIDNFCDLNYSRYSHVRVFRSAADPWVPARRVWNQHGYFNVNINDDLTIPIRQQKHHLVFSTGSCTVGPNRPLNGFLNQSPFLNIDGCPTYKSPDLAFVDNSLTVNPPTCPAANFTISFQFINQGDIGLSGNVPITFYNGNPAAGGTKLNTITIPLADLGIDEIHTVTNATVNGPGGSFTLYIVLNDSGNSNPWSLPNTSFLECDYTNNVLSAPVNPNPVPITAVLVNNNNKCVGSSSPNNGAVRAFIPVGATENTSDYNFYWSIGTTAKAIPADYQGATVNGLAEGTYTVFARHKTANCNSSTAQVTVARISPTIDVDIVLVHPFDNCQNPNGQLRAIVNDTDGNGVGDPVGNFTYVWYEGNDIFTDPQVSVSHLATGLKALTYTVVVTDKATGCQSINSFTVPDQSVTPVVATNVVNITCSTAATGSVSANVNGATNGFTFKWYNGTVVNPSPNFTGHTYNNRPAGSYTVVAVNNASKCESAPVTVTVTQTTGITVAVSGVNAMTSCDPSQPNGSASASVGGTISGYNFQWYNGQNTQAANLFSTSASVTGLQAGIYTVRATHATSGCTDTEEVTINFNVVTPSLIVGAVGNLTDCRTPNGSITVNVSMDTPADYTFRWFNGPSVKATPDFTDTDNVLNNLPVGQYTVQAIHNTKHCTTAPISATVNDNTPTIQIIQNSSVRKLPTDCRANDGLLEVSVSAAGNTLGFNMEWFRNSSATPFATFANVTTSRIDTLSSAMYTIRATNLDNGCSAEQTFELPFATAQDLDLVSKADATTCSPQNEGQIVVKLTPTAASIPGPPPISFSVDDYVINFFAGNGTSGALLQSVAGSTGTPNGDGTANYTLSGLTPGFYTVVAVESNPLLGGCASIPVIVEIVRTVNPPQIAQTANNANTNCSGATSTGSIVLDIDGASAENGYTYAWFEGPSTSSPPLGTATTGNTTNFGATAQNLPGGAYTVRVTNNTTLCETIGLFQIFNNPPLISIAEGDVALTSITSCAAPTAGNATVSTIRENGVSVGLANYSFTWLDANQNVLPNSTTPNTTNAISNLPAGEYSVLVTKTGGATGVNCASTQMSFVIEDETIGTVDVHLASFTYPTRCLQPSNRLGEMIAEGTGSSTTGYSYNWFTGSTTSGTLVSTSAAISNVSITLGEQDTTFTVEVTNNSNQCRIAATYVLPLEVVPVTMTSSAASPMTSCQAADGTVFATVTSGNSNGYLYEWSIGTTVQSPAAFTGKQFTGLNVNDYTVIATDLADSFCQSEPQTVGITDGRMFPVVTATQNSPVTICDPTRPDGVAAASVGGDVINYFFDWYASAPPTGTAVHRGSEFGNLAASTYSVIATHMVTGCADTTQVVINTNTAIIPVPTVVVLSDVTSCVVDNGTLQASVNGNTGDYIFHWYNENPGTPVDTTSSDYIGEIYSNLAVGTYYVSATSRQTGCISGPANGPIIANPIYPDFDFKITPSSCDETNGSIALFMLNEVDIASIVWSHTGSDIDGPLLDQIPAGTYSVTVTTIMGCAETKEVEVKTEIRPYNGISRNIDGKNDFFHINCIENFPDNVVKIFNRAGTLVFEAEGYDNTSTYFDGKSNKGIAVMGNNLPDGTYFYIIDKRDGTKPLAGYLEVVK